MSTLTAHILIITVPSIILILVVAGYVLWVRSLSRSKADK